MTNSCQCIRFEHILRGLSALTLNLIMEDVLKSDRITVERKQFLFDLKENPRGKFLRITEDVNGRRDTIIIPAPGLDDFIRALEGMAEAYKNAEADAAREAA